MTTDALDPGPDGVYPHWPRNPDGSTDRSRMPSKPYRQLVNGQWVLIDPRPGKPGGGYVEDDVPTTGIVQRADGTWARAT